MLITTMMIAVLALTIWQWPKWWAVPLLAVLLVIDGAYFASNLTKIPDGGWFPLLVGAIAFTLLTTWARGRQLMMLRLRESAMPIEVFIKSAASAATRVPGTAVFMTSSPEGVPHALLHNLKHNKVLHERVLILTVVIDEVPFVDDEDRMEVRSLGSNFYRMIVRYGFMQEIDVPATLKLVEKLRAEVQDDGHQLLPRPPDAAGERPAGHGDLAREAVRLDAEQCGKRDGVLQAADQPRRRAGEPGRDLRRGPDRRRSGPSRFSCAGRRRSRGCWRSPAG